MNEFQNGGKKIIPVTSIFFPFPLVLFVVKAPTWRYAIEKAEYSIQIFHIYAKYSLNDDMLTSCPISFTS